MRESNYMFLMYLFGCCLPQTLTVDFSDMSQHHEGLTGQPHDFTEEEDLVHWRRKEENKIRNKKWGKQN